MAFQVKYRDEEGNTHSFVSDAEHTTEAFHEMTSQSDYFETLSIIKIEPEGEGPEE